MGRRALAVILGTLLCGGCAAFQVRQGLLEGNVLYSSLIPEQQVKVSAELTHVDQEDRQVWVAMENRPTTFENGRLELFRFENRTTRSGLLITLAHAPMDMVLVPGFGFDFLSRCLEDDSYEIDDRTVYTAVLRDGEFLFVKSTFLLQGLGRASVTIDYWEPIAAADQALFRNRKSLTEREKTLIAGIQARAREKFSLVNAPSTVGLSPRPGTPSNRPFLPQPPSDQPVAYPAPKSGGFGAGGR